MSGYGVARLFLTRGWKRSGRLPTTCGAMGSINVAHQSSVDTFVLNRGSRWCTVWSVPWKPTRHGHHLSDQIISDQVPIELIANSVRSLATPVVHLHYGLPASQIELRIPAAPVELRDFRPWTLLGVEQRRDHDQRARAKAFSWHEEEHFPQREIGWQRVIGFWVHPIGARGFRPMDQAIAAAEPSARAKVGGAPLMLANHHMDAALLEQRHVETNR